MLGKGVESMLDEICPVQFIEGVNENEEASDENVITTKGFAGVALEYIPKLTYSLKRLCIFLAGQHAPEGHKFKVALCTDHDEKPSNIVLSSGEWTSKEISDNWQEVELEPVVVIRNNRYWITIDVGKGRIALPIARAGDEVALRFRGATRWVKDDTFKTDKAMLKFYGRILPSVG